MGRLGRKRRRSASSRIWTGTVAFSSPLRETCTTIRSICSASSFLYGSVLLFRHAWRHHPGRQPLRRRQGSRAIGRSWHRLGNAPPCFWRWTMGFNATMESIHRWAWWFAVLTPITGRHRLSCSPVRLVDNWFLWAVKHGVGALLPRHLRSHRRPGGQQRRSVT